MDNTDYEEKEVKIIANRKLRGSVMNIALPANSEDKKKSEGNKSETGKRKRSEVDQYERVENHREQSLDNIRKAFEQHANEGNQSIINRANKRVKTSDKEERSYIHINGDEKPCSEATAVTSGPKTKDKIDDETPLRKLSISNFEPLQPKNKTALRDSNHTHVTPQPNRTENMIINQLVFK